jgi:hypothetical protein
MCVHQKFKEAHYHIYLHIATVNLDHIVPFAASVNIILHNFIAPFNLSLHADLSEMINGP